MNPDSSRLWSDGGTSSFRQVATNTSNSILASVQRVEPHERAGPQAQRASRLPGGHGSLDPSAAPTAGGSIVAPAGRATPAGHSHSASASASCSAASASPMETVREPPPSRAASCGLMSETARRSETGAVCEPARSNRRTPAVGGSAASSSAEQSSESPSKVKIAVAAGAYPARAAASSSGVGETSTATPCATPSCCTKANASRTAPPYGAAPPPCISPTSFEASSTESATRKLLKFRSASGSACGAPPSPAPASHASSASSFAPRLCPTRKTGAPSGGARPCARLSSSAASKSEATRRASLRWSRPSSYGVAITATSAELASRLSSVS
mmetsp:Transcript_9876/g.31317  ORF Transcript_9876/g.31317 Transcript_9876/m.31317 type:complete len:329 (-) Transcript_9876:315-1301(-)